MYIAQAPDLVSCYDATRNPLTSFGDFLDPELVARCPALTRTAECLESGERTPTLDNPTEKGPAHL